MGPQIQMLLLRDCRQDLTGYCGSHCHYIYMNRSFFLRPLHSLNYAKPCKVQPLSLSPFLLPHPMVFPLSFLLLCIYILYDLLLKHIF